MAQSSLQPVALLEVQTRSKKQGEKWFVTLLREGQLKVDLSIASRWTRSLRLLCHPEMPKCRFSLPPVHIHGRSN